MKLSLQRVGILFFVSLLVGASCTNQIAKNCPSGNIQEVLQKAGENRKELEKVILHYKEKNDTLGLKAACFLISNLEGHRYTIFGLYDTNKTEVDFDVLAYPDYETMVKAWDKVEAERGELDFDKKENIMDIDVITADYLIENIDWALKAWREKPWAKHLSFEDFCEYVLPYRGSGEPLESWRQPFWKRYEGLEKKMKNPEDPVEAAQLINEDIKTWFKFDPRFYRHPTDQGFHEMLANRMGRCEDMTNLTIYAMRANGIAVTSDYTPHWADRDNNHAWNAIVTREGKAIPFMGAGENPGKYKLFAKAAKVYRKTFSQHKENLAFQKAPGEKVPPWMSGKSYIDVTAEYEEVCDVTTPFPKPVADSIHHAYLCVFNGGEWQAIHWGTVENQQALFTDMGKEIAYLPMFYLNEELVPAGLPFILRDDCSQTVLSADTTHRITVQLNAVFPPSKEVPPGKSLLTPGQEYEFFYWDDGWQSLGKKVAGKKPLTFDNVPTNGLYWLVATDSHREKERIFTLHDGRQVWW